MPLRGLVAINCTTARLRKLEVSTETGVLWFRFYKVLEC